MLAFKLPKNYNAKGLNIKNFTEYLKTQGFNLKKTITITTDISTGDVIFKQADRGEKLNED